MKICYVEKRFSEGRLDTISRANDIIEEYTRQGFSLTLRQLYYQFVARGLVENTMRSYKNLGSVMNDARLAGLVSWYALEDRTRNRQGNQHWENPGEIVDACVASYKVDLWEGQPFRPEVWVEKEALIGVFSRVCRELDIDYFACRGYTSQSEQWNSGRRFRHLREDGQSPVILHFGDHDPSGIDMTRDNRDRLSMFAEGRVEVRRLALNMDQVEQYRPPPNPAKTTDSRFEQYVSQFGEESWELDALEPSMLAELVRTEVMQLRNEEIYEERLALQNEGRAQLKEVAEELGHRS